MGILQTKLVLLNLSCWPSATNQNQGFWTPARCFSCRGLLRGVWCLPRFRVEDIVDKLSQGNNMTHSNFVTLKRKCKEHQRGIYIQNLEMQNYLHRMMFHSAFQWCAETFLEGPYREAKANRWGMDLVETLTKRQKTRFWSLVAEGNKINSRKNLKTMVLPSSTEETGVFPYKKPAGEKRLTGFRQRLHWSTHGSALMSPVGRDWRFRTVWNLSWVCFWEI